MESISKWSANRKFYTLFFIMVGAMVIFAIWNFKREIKAPANPGMEFSQPKSDFFYDLEESLDITNISTIIKGEAFSGNQMAMLNDTIEYGVTFARNAGEIKDYASVKSVRFAFRIKSDLPLKSALAVLEIQGEDNVQKYWNGASIANEPGKWNLSENSFELNGLILKQGDIIRLYIWNKDKEKFLTDDFSLQFK